MWSALVEGSRLSVCETGSGATWHVLSPQGRVTANGSEANPVLAMAAAEKAAEQARKAAGRD